MNYALKTDDDYAVHELSLEFEGVDWGEGREHLPQSPTVTMLCKLPKDDWHRMSNNANFLKDCMTWGLARLIHEFGDPVTAKSCLIGGISVKPPSTTRPSGTGRPSSHAPSAS